MEALERLRQYFVDRHSLIVAFSGGVDSAVLTKVAHQTLGDRMVAVTGDSASVPSCDRAAVVAFCERHGIPHEFIATRELDDPRYRANAGNRCYFCKHELFRRLDQIRRERDFAWIAEGTNVSDRAGHRPGGRAALESDRVISPYCDCRIDKPTVRAIARSLQLECAEKPATACLASRVPVGTPVMSEALRRIDAAEEVLRNLGCAHVRVRYHETVARIEVDPSEFARCCAAHAAIVDALRAIGFRHITLDLAGYRMGGGIDGVDD